MNNKIDILDEEIDEYKVKLRDREDELDNAKREKNKYHKALEEKYDYIEELEEAIKIKVNEVDQMKEE